MLPTLTRTLCLVIPLIAACDKGPTRSSSQQPAVATAPAVAPSSSVPEGTKFGAGVTLTDTVAVGAILADPNAYKGKTVRIEGMVTDVCPKRGCWFELAGSAPGQKLKFKVTDGDMVFPMDAKGKIAIAQGEVSVRELTLEETKQNAEYEAKEYGKPYDPASITTPKSIVRIDGTGAVFRDKI